MTEPLPWVDWDADGRPHWKHTCNGERVSTQLPIGPWRANRETNSVSPSLFCQGCGLHGFWTNGEWRD